MLLECDCQRAKKVVEDSKDGPVNCPNCGQRMYTVITLPDQKAKD